VAKGRSLLSNPDILYFICVICFFTFCAAYVGYKNSGIINGIVSGLRGIYNMIYGTAFVGYMFVTVAWEEKSHIIIEWIIDRI
jgi:hypothetical protein